MPTGSCLCGDIKISYTGDPLIRALCHCHDCRKLSGGGLVFQVPEDAFKIDAGTPKSYTKLSDHEREITTAFCGNCGTSMYRTGGAPQVKGMVGIRAPVLDDPIVASEDGKPMLEVYVERRPVWMPKIDGIAQMTSKYEIVEGSLPGHSDA